MGREGAHRLRVGGWVPEPDVPADDDAPTRELSTELAVPDATAEPGPVVADDEAEPAPGNLAAGPRVGVRTNAVAGLVAVAVVLAVLAVGAYQSMLRGPAGGPGPYGAGPAGSPGVDGVPEAGRNGAATPSASGSAPAATTSPSPAPAGSSAPPGLAGSTGAPAAVPSAAPVAGPVGEVSNGDFESGTLAGWACANRGRIVPSPVHSGQYALAGDAIGEGHTARCAQTVAVQPGRRYTVTAWVSGPSAFLGVSGADGGDVQASATDAASYTQLRVTFVVPSLTSTVTVWVRGGHGTGTYYADDISMS